MKKEKQADSRSRRRKPAATRQHDRRRPPPSKRRPSQATKTDPKALSDKGSKQKAVASTTEAASTGNTTAADAAKAKANVDATKNDPKAVKPDMKDPAVQKSMQKAATP